MNDKEVLDQLYLHAIHIWCEIDLKEWIEGFILYQKEAKFRGIYDIIIKDNALICLDTRKSTKFGKQKLKRLEKLKVFI